MSPASGDYLDGERDGWKQPSLFTSFHSINVPSEWGLTGPGGLILSTSCGVSIQLMSPASGDTSILNPYLARCPETVSEGQKKKC